MIVFVKNKKKNWQLEPLDTLFQLFVFTKHFVCIWLILNSWGSQTGKRSTFLWFTFRWKNETETVMPLYLCFPGIQRAHGLHVIFLIGLLNLLEGLLTPTNLAGCCWRTRDYERAQCMEKGPRGGFSAPILPLPSSAATNALLDLCLLISVSMVKLTVLWIQVHQTCLC